MFYLGLCSWGLRPWSLGSNALFEWSSTSFRPIVSRVLVHLSIHSVLISACIALTETFQERLLVSRYNGEEVQVRIMITAPFFFFDDNHPSSIIHTCDSFLPFLPLFDSVQTIQFIIIFCLVVSCFCLQDCSLFLYCEPLLYIQHSPTMTISLARKGCSQTLSLHCTPERVHAV